MSRRTSPLLSGSPRRWLMVAGAGSIALGAMTPAHGQSCVPHTKRYEFVPLGQLFQSPGADSFAYGINELGEIVGAAEDSNFLLRATLWLYCQNYDETAFPARTLINLSSLAQQAGGGLARDINDAGDVVGRQVATSDSGFIWRLPTYSTTPSSWTIELQPGDFNAVEAYAISETSPPTVVGRVQDLGLCGGLPGSQAFRYVIGDPDLTMDGDNVLAAGTAGAEATDVGSTTPMRVGGGTVGCAGLNPPPCQADDNAILWTVSPAGSTALTDSGLAYGSKVNAVNDADMAAGWVRVGNTACRQHASWWPSPSGSPVDLHVIGWDADDQSEALGMGDVATDGSVQVVGTSITLFRAALWQRDSQGSWTFSDLNCEISPLCEWVLTRAEDVNDSGWIVGVGFVDEQPSKQRAFLLRPIELPGDVDYDCVVDGSDVGLLLSAYGSDPINCNFDLTLDGLVDSADLGIVLSDWGETCESPCETSAAMAAASLGNDAMGAALLQALASLGFESVAAFNVWASAVPPANASAILEQLSATLVDMASDGGES